MEKRPPKPLEWVGSSLDDLSAFPAAVKRKVGFALRAAQNGEKSPDASPMTGFGGAGVLEIVEDFDGNTYRAVYTVKLRVWCTYFMPSRKNRNTGSKHRSTRSK